MSIQLPMEGERQRQYVDTLFTPFVAPCQLWKLILWIRTQKILGI
jgi:hypothetical protein